jgi:hypothetical protein
VSGGSSKRDVKSKCKESVLEMTVRSYFQVRVSRVNVRSPARSEYWKLLSGERLFNKCVSRECQPKLSRVNARSEYQERVSRTRMSEENVKRKFQE